MEASGPPPAADDPLAARSVRFALTVLTPVLLGLALGGGPWLPYALLGAIGAFSADTGGKALPRLGWMLSVAAVLIGGGAIGLVVAGSPILICLAFAIAGVIYALTESAHQIALTLSRFLHIALAISALYAPMQVFDVGVILAATLLAWTIAIAWDALARRELASTVPHWRLVAAELKARERRRITFAAAMAIAVPCAYLASLSLGLVKPYWTLLAMVLVLRVDFMESGRLMAERFFGTIVGVGIAGALALFFPSYEVLVVALVVAALLRWPAQQRHGLLGVAALTAFVMLMIEIASLSSGHVLPILEARVLDTGVGCLFAVLALGLDRTLMALWSAAERR